MRIASFSLITLTAFAATPPIVQAQNAGTKNDEEKALITQVFQLAHTDPGQVQDVLQTMLAGETIRLAAIPESRQLLVSTDQETLEKIHALIEQLDRPPREVPEESDRHIEIIRLRRLAPIDAVDLIGSLFLSRSPRSTLMVVPDPNSQSVIARGSERELAQLEAFIGKYESQPDDDSTMVRILDLKFRSAEEVMHLVQSLVVPAMSVSRLEDGRKLLVRGPTRDVDRIQRIVDEVDQPKSSLQLIFSIVQGEETEQPFPDFLRPALEALAQSGLAEAHLLTTLSIRTHDDSEFTASGTIGNDRVNINGRARLVKERNAVQIRVETEVDRRQPGDPGGEQQDCEGPIFHAGTEILTPVGDSVLIVSAPGPGESELPIALILRAVPVD